MSRRRIINQSTAENLVSFDPDVLSDCHDVETLVQLFNKQSSSVLDSVAPFKSETISFVKSSPWINESIRSFRRNCRKTERL